jgi:YfiR/HmsC-like
MTRRPASGARLFAALLLSVCVPASAGAQTGSASSLRAGFLFNFAKFTEWPADVLPPAAPLVICVIGDGPSAEILEHTTRRQVVQGHPVVVWKGQGEGSVRSCQVLFLGKSLEKQVLAVIDSVKGAAVLTVSEAPLFAQTGGTVQLFTENDRMRFAVNVEAAQRHRLRLSAQLLSLAKLVKDDKDASQH